MFRIPLTHTKSRRDPAGSLRNSRPRKHPRLLRRRLQAERLEDRQLLATISGQVFNDLNSDGLKDAGESGQSGWTIYLDADGNGQLDAGETSATTAADGSYGFDGLAPGAYTVAEVQQSGWRQTYPVGTAAAIERVSVGADGTEANGSSYSSSFSISADGRYVTFSSKATNLVAGDTNGMDDVFVYDCQEDTIELVSLASDGTQGNDWSQYSTISADGRYVAFQSSASNLVPGDTNRQQDSFVYDRETDAIERVSLAADGTEANASSPYSSISADGRYVAFTSYASNLVPGDTNGQLDVFVYDRQTPHTIERVSLATDGTQANKTSGLNGSTISADGRYVAFESSASNLVPGDTNGVGDVFVYDRQTDTIERVSLATDGTQGNRTSQTPSISADGRYVTFESGASNLVPGDTNGKADIFVYDRQTDTIERVSLATDGTQPDNTSAWSSISADGRYVGFCSWASNLVPGDTNGLMDVFLYDRQTDTIERVSVAFDGTQANGQSVSFAISADGRYVAFQSSASNLVPGATRGGVFVTPNPFAPGSHVVVVETGQEVSAVDFGNASLITKFCVVNDASQDRTYAYNASGGLVEAYSLNSGNTAPRGAASTVAGDKTWVVDANRKVYVYDNSGALLGSWTAGTLSTKAVVEGIATNGTDVWIVDAYSDKVYKYAGGAARLSGTWTATSFSLNSANKDPKDIVTNGVNLWVVNNSTTDKVFKYTTSGSLVSSWTITTSGAANPTGITVDPASVSNIWIVDSGADRVYQYNAAATFANGSSHAADFSFALAAGNNNPQGIADPPSVVAQQSGQLALTPSPTQIASATDAVLQGMARTPKIDGALFRTGARRVEANSGTSAKGRFLAADSASPQVTMQPSAAAAPVDRSCLTRSTATHRQQVHDEVLAAWNSESIDLMDLGLANAT